MTDDRDLYNVNNLWAKKMRDRDLLIMIKGYNRQILVIGEIVFIEISYSIITFDKKDLCWKPKAIRIGLHTGRCLSHYQDELDNTTEKYQGNFQRDLPEIW